MDKEKTLQKIVKKAEEGGFDMKPYLPAFPNQRIAGKFLQIIYKEFIYTHKFAKSFWNKKRISYILKCHKCKSIYNYFNEIDWNVKYCSNCGTKVKKEIEYSAYTWEHHLQKMMLEKDHIKYLSKFLKK